MPTILATFTDQILATLFGTSVLIIVILLSFRKLPPPDMPLVSTCSAAISAACHPPEYDSVAHLFPVKWGVVTENEKPARCAFTTWRNVRQPDADEELVGRLNSDNR
jgi:hypothetical protein